MANWASGVSPSARGLFPDGCDRPVLFPCHQHRPVPRRDIAGNPPATERLTGWRRRARSPSRRRRGPHRHTAPDCSRPARHPGQCDLRLGLALSGQIHILLATPRAGDLDRFRTTSPPPSIGHASSFHLPTPAFPRATPAALLQTHRVHIARPIRRIAPHHHELAVPRGRPAKDGSIRKSYRPRFRRALRSCPMWRRRRPRTRPTAACPWARSGRPARPPRRVPPRPRHRVQTFTRRFRTIVHRHRRDHVRPPRPTATTSGRPLRSRSRSPASRCPR